MPWYKKNQNNRHFFKWYKKYVTEKGEKCTGIIILAYGKHINTNTKRAKEMHIAIETRFTKMT